MLSALGEPIVDSELVSVAAADSAGEALPPEEIAANTAAAEFCVPAADLVDFVLRGHVMNWEARVVEFAHRIGVHPGLVAG